MWVASAVDTDFTAKLIDVYPPNAWYYPARSGPMAANCEPQAVAASSKPSATTRARGGSI